MAIDRYRVSYAVIHPATCRIVHTWDEVVLCDLESVIRSTITTRDCQEVSQQTGVQPNSDCCGGTLGVGTGTSILLHQYIVKYGTINLNNCSVQEVCTYLTDCPQDYGVLGENCWYAATFDPFANPSFGLPLFPSNTIKMWVAHPYYPLSFGATSKPLEAFANSHGVTFPITLTYLANQGEDWTLSFPTRGPLVGKNTKIYQYSFYNNINPTTGAIISLLSDALSVEAYLLVNDEFFIPGLTGTGTGQAPGGHYYGCASECLIRYYQASSASGGSKSFGGGLYGSAGTSSVFTFYTDPIRIEFGPLLFETEPPSSAGGIIVENPGGLVVFDLDVPPMRTARDSTYQIPDTLTATVAGTGSVDGTYTLTYQKGLWLGYLTFGGFTVQAGFYPTMMGSDGVGTQFKWYGVITALNNATGTVSSVIFIETSWSSNPLTWDGTDSVSGGTMSIIE